MDLFKKKLEAKDIFPTVKTATLVVDTPMDNWRTDVDKYLIDKYPELAGGFRPVNFKRVEEETGDAVGSVVYEQNGVKIIIPIIISDHKLKEPDVGIMDDNVVPIDKDYIEWIMVKGGNDGTLSETSPAQTKGLTFIKSIFDDTNIDRNGRPVGHSVKLGGYIKSAQDFLKDSEDIPLPLKKIAEFIAGIEIEKNAEKVVDIVANQVIDEPYTYDAKLLIKSASGDLSVRDSVLSEEELQKINVSRECSVKPDMDKVAQAFNKIFTPKENGYYVVEGLGEEGSTSIVIVSPKSLFGEKNIGGMLAIREGSNPEWGYGDLVVTTDNNGIVGARLSSPSEKEFPLMESGGYISFKIPANAKDSGDVKSTLSVPYKVLHAETTKSMSTGEEHTTYDLECPDGEKVRAWIIKGIDKIVKANKDKMKENGYKMQASTPYDVYVVPKKMTVIPLLGKKVDVSGVREKAKELISKVAGDYKGQVIISKLGDDSYLFDNNGVQEVISKEAALLYSRYYIDENMESVDDLKGIDYRKPYFYKKAEATPKLKAMDKYRGEWIKAAYIIASNMEQSNIKIAEVGEVVNDLAGIELMDDPVVSDVDEAVDSLNDAISDVGQLLLLTRSSKIGISESTLAKTFYALRDLVNEIHGSTTT